MKQWKLWKATDDERLLAESGKIYRIGFWLLAAGVPAAKKGRPRTGGPWENGR